MEGLEKGRKTEKQTSQFFHVLKVALSKGGMREGVCIHWLKWELCFLSVDIH